MTNKRYMNPYLFILITFIGTWGMLIPSLFTNNLALVFLGGFIPSITGIILTSIGSDKVHRKDFWNRVFSIKLIDFRYIIIIFITFPSTGFISYLIMKILNIGTKSFEQTLQILNNPKILGIFLFSAFLSGPLSEELGWRGYLLDCLQNKANALISSILLGTIHAFWHIPLFFIKGTLQEKIGLFSFNFFLWSISIILFSIFMTYIYNNNNRSILSAILLHFTYNLTAAMTTQLNQTAPPVAFFIVRLFILSVLVVLILAFTDYRTFTKKNTLRLMT